MKRMFIALALILFLPSFIFAETNEPSAEDLAGVMNGIGVANINRGQYDKAIEDFNTAIVLNPKFAVPYSSRGLTYNKKGQYDKAIEDFNTAIVLNPNYALAYSGRGFAYAKKGNMDRAISDFQKACDMGDKTGCNNLQIFKNH